jgi:stearoyl-CoA desaturase (delta-9 desaturase)
MPVDLLMLGEGLHNNHHKHSGRANFGWKKWEFDPVYPIIWVLAKVNVIKLRAVEA